jgi:hypothetical protein
MSFLSNIGSSIANIAQEAVSDIESVGGGSLADSVTSLAQTGLDSFMRDLGGGLENIGRSFINAGQDLIQNFSQPGSIYPPANPNDPSQGGFDLPSDPTGYAPLPGAPTSSGDTGVIGNPTGLPTLDGSQGGAPTDTTSAPTVTDSGDVGPGMSAPTDQQVQKNSGMAAATGDDALKSIEDQTTSDVNNIMNNPALSLESKIFMILLALQKGKREEMKEHLQKATDLKKSSSGMTGADKDKADADANQETQLLQQSASDLNELTTMTTNIQKLQHDMKMASIQNIR